MSTETRSVVVKLRAEAGGFVVEFDRAGRAADRMAGRVDRSGASIQRLTRLARNVALGAGFAKLATDAVRLEAAYSKTMAQVAVASGAPQKELAKLDALALKLGRDTVFSAQDAAAAMLSLSKGGLSPAQIQAGALADTLTLASAGGLELEDASKAVVNAMGAFKISAKDTDVAVAALAGSANASSAEVADITQSLAQVGPVARGAGLDIQQTTGFLALFANQGFKGSDAGTSLRTMLGRLVPQTDAAKNAMADLNLTYLDANGNLVDATQIAERTRQAFSGLTDEQRISAAQTIFGQDALRGVNAIVNEGRGGLEKYIKSTSDLTQAQKLAKAANSGTAGALENLKGSIETAEIQIGRGLAPVVQDAAEKLNHLVADQDMEAWGRKAGTAVRDFASEMAPLVKSAAELGIQVLPALNDALHLTVGLLEAGADVVKPFVDAFNSLPDSAQKAIIMAGGVQLLGRRLRGTDSIAGSAAGNVLLFGGNAKKAGADAERGSKGFGALGTALKTNALLLGASFAAPKIFDAFSQAFDDIGNHAPDIDELTASMDRFGYATDETFGILNKNIASGDIGRFADKFGIDLDKLQESLGKGGTKGKYYADTVEGLKQKFVELAQAGHLDLDLGDVIGDLEQLGEAFDGAHTKALKVNESMTDLNITMAYGVGEANSLGARLLALPTEVKTLVTTPGALDSIGKVTALARKYRLTPAQVRTVMEAKDFASKDIDKVIGKLKQADKTKAQPKVNVDTGNSISDMERLRNLLLGIRSKTIYVKVKQTGAIRVNPGDAGGGQQLPQSYTGGLLGPGFAGGGRVPGVAPTNPNVDNVVAVGARTGRPLLVRSGEWIINEQSSKENDAYLAWANAGGRFADLFGAFADGGRYGRDRAGGSRPVLVVAGGGSGGGSTDGGAGSARLMASYVREGVMAGLQGATFKTMPDGNIRLIVKRGR